MRPVIRLAVLVAMGCFAACATSEDPADQGAQPTPTTKDAAADAKKDTGGNVVDDSGTDEDSGTEEDSGTQDAGKDAKTDTGTDANVTDTGTDATQTDADTDASQTDAGTDADTDATVDDGGTDAGTDADLDASGDVNQPDVSILPDGACNDLDYGAAALQNTRVNQAAPGPKGGALQNGTYNLTGYNWYNFGTSGTFTLRAVVRITGNNIESLFTLNGAESRQSGTYVLNNDNTITVTWKCGSTLTETHGYTATANAFTYYYPSSSIETLYTK